MRRRGKSTLPGYTEHRKLQAVAEVAIAPLQVIRDGTQVSADALGLREMDSRVAGKRADVIVLDANQLDDMENTRTISAVYVCGPDGGGDLASGVNSCPQLFDPAEGQKEVPCDYFAFSPY